MDKVINTDPTAEEMREHLNKQFPNPEPLEGCPTCAELQFDIETAIFFFCVDFHGGQDTNMYSALSTSEFEPGPICKITDPGFSIAMEYYCALETEFTTRQQIEERYGKAHESPYKPNPAMTQARKFETYDATGHIVGKLTPEQMKSLKAILKKPGRMSLPEKPAQLEGYTTLLREDMDKLMQRAAMARSYTEILEALKGMAKKWIKVPEAEWGKYPGYIQRALRAIDNEAKDVYIKELFCKDEAQAMPPTNSKVMEMIKDCIARTKKVLIKTPSHGLTPGDTMTLSARPTPRPGCSPPGSTTPPNLDPKV